MAARHRRLHATPRRTRRYSGASPDGVDELAQLLDTPDPAPVLRVLRQETLALVLRTRIVAETRKHR